MRSISRGEGLSGLKHFLGLSAIFSLLMLLGTYSSQAQPAPLASLKGDINGDGLIGLSDAILGLQVITSMNPQGVRGDYVTSRVDVNNDNQFGLPDLIYVFQRIAGRNGAPVIDIGPDRIGSLGSTVKLSAHRSSDADGDPLTYSWSLISKPPSSTAALSDNTAEAPSFTPDMEGAYRLSCVVNDGYLDSELVTITITAAKDEYITISPDGGQYHFANGISVNVPAGAVSAETQISMRFIDYETAASIMENSGLTDKKLIVALNAEPSGLTFAVPISVKLPAGVPSAGGIPYQFSMDTEKEACTPVFTDLKWDPNQHEIEMSVSSFSKKAAAEIQKKHDLYAKEYCRQIGECKCGVIKVLESSRDNIYNSGGCQIGEIKGSVQFLRCENQPVENYGFTEITSGCEPELKITQRSESRGCQLAGIKALLTIKGLPLEGQRVDFAVSPPGKIDPSVTETSSSGEAYGILFSGIEEGKVTLTVTVSADAVWALEYITAGGQTFTANKRTKHLKQSLDVEVKELPTTGKEIGFAPTVFYPEIWFNFDDHTCPSGIRLGFQPGDGYVSCGVGGFYADWDPGAREIALAAGINNISQIGDPSTHDWGQYHWDFMALTPDHVPLHVSPGQVLLLRNTDSGCYAAVRVDAIYGGNWTMSCIGALTDFTWHFLGCF